MNLYLFSCDSLSLIVKAADAFDATIIVNHHLRRSRLMHRFEEIDAMKLEITKSAGMITEKIGSHPWSDQYL